MPFSLTNTTAVFQALVNDVLHDMLNQFLFVYIDKIFERPDRSMCSTFALFSVTFSRTSCFFKAKKCEFRSSSVTSLCFVLQQGQLPDPANIRAVVEWPPHLYANSPIIFWCLQIFTVASYTATARL